MAKVSVKKSTAIAVPLVMRNAAENRRQHGGEVDMPQQVAAARAQRTHGKDQLRPHGIGGVPREHENLKIEDEADDEDLRGFAHPQKEHDDGQQHNLGHRVDEVDERTEDAVDHWRLAHGHARGRRENHRNDDAQHHAVRAVEHVLPQAARPLPRESLRHHPRHRQDRLSDQQRPLPAHTATNATTAAIRNGSVMRARGASMAATFYPVLF